MEVRISVEGEGSTSGAGTYSNGDRVSVKATPVPGNAFMFWQRNNITVTDNPYVFQVNDNFDVELKAIFFVTIESYLRASVGFQVPDATLTKIRIDRGIKHNENIQNVSEMLRELSYADLLMWGANSPSEVQGAKNSDFGWSSQEASSTMSITDKKRMSAEAKAIYRRYNDKVSAPSIKMISIFGTKRNDSKY